MPTKSFGTKKLVGVLKNLLFTPQKQSGSSHHKWRVSDDIEVKPGQRPFITVILNKKTYVPPTCSSYLSQLRKFGYSKKDLQDLLS